MNRPASPNRPLPGVRPLLGWSLAILSAFLLSPASATALMHLWAQESTAPPPPAGLIAQPRRSNDAETLYAAHTPADETPRTEPAPDAAPIAPARPARVAVADSRTFSAPVFRRAPVAPRSAPRVAAAPRAPPAV